MKLFYMTEFEKPDPELENIFDDIQVIKAYHENQEEQVPGVEEEMKKRGSEPFSRSEFFLYTPEVEDLGQVVERNRLNSGIETSAGRFRLGRTHIDLSHAVSLPYSGDSEIEIWAPHYEEDFAMILAATHKMNGDSVHITFVTDIPDYDREKKSYEIRVKKSFEVYHNVLGLKEEEYDFIGIPDREVHKHETRVADALKDNLKRIRPKNVIIPSDGRNFDHKNIQKIAYQIIPPGVNVIMGRSVQSVGFSPEIWEAHNPDYIKFLVSSMYSDDVFGSKEYVTQVGKLFEELPEPLVRHLGDIRRNEYSRAEFKAYGLMPLRMNHEFRVAHTSYGFRPFASLQLP